LFPNVERLNLFTGNLTMVVKNPGKVVSWITDHHGVVRAGLEKEEKRFRILYRADAKAAWTTLAEFDWNQIGFLPATFEPDNRTMLVRSEGDGDTEALYSYDSGTRKLKELAFRHAEVDLDELIFGNNPHRLAGVTFETERPEVMWFDPKYRQMQG